MRVRSRGLKTHFVQSFAWVFTCRVNFHYPWETPLSQNRTSPSVKGGARDYRDAHPSHALLVVEVAGTILDYGRGRKLPVYARAGIPEYWIREVESGVLEVYREPGGEGYATKEVLHAGDRVTAPSAVGGAIAVSDLLP